MRCLESRWLATKTLMRVQLPAGKILIAEYFLQLRPYNSANIQIGWFRTELFSNEKWTQKIHILNYMGTKSLFKRLVVFATFLRNEHIDKGCYWYRPTYSFFWVNVILMRCYSELTPILWGCQSNLLFSVLSFSIFIPKTSRLFFFFVFCFLI